MHVLNNPTLRYGGLLFEIENFYESTIYPAIIHRIFSQMVNTYHQNLMSIPACGKSQC